MRNLAKEQEEKPSVHCHRTGGEWRRMGESPWRESIAPRRYPPLSWKDWKETAAVLILVKMVNAGGYQRSRVFQRCPASSYKGRWQRIAALSVLRIIKRALPQLRLLTVWTRKTARSFAVYDLVAVLSTSLSSRRTHGLFEVEVHQWC